MLTEWQETSRLGVCVCVLQWINFILGVYSLLFHSVSGIGFGSIAIPNERMMRNGDYSQLYVFILNDVTKSFPKPVWFFSFQNLTERLRPQRKAGTCVKGPNYKLTFQTKPWIISLWALYYKKSRFHSKPQMCE